MNHRVLLGFLAFPYLIASLATSQLACSNNKSNGAGGQGGGSGDAVAPGTGGAAVAAVNSVFERNNHPSRDGHFLQPTLTKAAAAQLKLDTTFEGTYTGNTWASPLFLENGPGGKGIFIVVTNGNNVYAIDETAGTIVWTRNIGTPAGRTGAGCGDIAPLGIISTPVIDPQTRTIYVAGAIGTATAITSHQIHALSPDDGTERAGWPIEVNGMTSGTATFTPAPQNQRSALSLVGGVLYVAYGGHNGDCGAYHGWVITINVADPTQRGAFVTGGARGEAIWAAGGMASDGTGVFAVTGNLIGVNANTVHVDSEEVVRVTGMGSVDRTSDQSVFFPTTWRAMDMTDADFGASSPVYLTQPSPMVAAVSKDGHLYLLDSHNLGGMGGQLADLVLASGGAMLVHTTPAAYATGMGTHLVLTTNAGAQQCPSGGGSGKVVMSVLVPAGTPVVPRVAWCVPVANAALGFPASPMATTTDGHSEAIVWFMNGTQLMGVDGDTGATVFAGATADACAGVHKWTTPIAVKGRIVVAADNRLCSWSAH